MKKEKGDPKLLEGAAWYLQCPRHMRKRQSADFMAWSYLFIWAGMFD